MSEDLEAKYSVLNTRIDHVLEDMSKITRDIDKLINKMDMFMNSLSSIQTIIDRWVGALRLISILMLLVMGGLSFFIRREVDHNDRINTAQTQNMEQLNNRVITIEQQILFIKKGK